MDLIKSNIIKLYGLNHSGSHYLSWLLDKNFFNTVILHSHTGWNHGKIVTEFNWDASKWNDDPFYLKDKVEHGIKLKKESLNNGKSVIEYESEIKHLYDTKTLPIIVLIRNPYTWLYSYCVKHYRDGGGRSLERAMKLWTDLNKSYFNTNWPKTHIIKYEKLRDDTKTEVKKIANFLNLNHKEEFVDTNKNAIRLHHSTSTNQQFEKTDESEYEYLIDKLSKHENITSKKFNEMFDSLIDLEIYKKYNEL